MSLRKVKYANEQALIADIDKLRKGYKTDGKWTLAQACFHCGWALTKPVKAPHDPEATPEQQKNRAFVDTVIENGWPSNPGESPPPMVPPADVGDEVIDAFVANLRRMAKCPVPVLDNAMFGPLPLDVWRQFVLIHAAHHFAFFHPTA